MSEYFLKLKKHNSHEFQKRFIRHKKQSSLGKERVEKYFKELSPQTFRQKSRSRSELNMNFIFQPHNPPQFDKNIEIPEVSKEGNESLDNRLKSNEKNDPFNRSREKQKIHGNLIDWIDKIIDESSQENSRQVLGSRRSSELLWSDGVGRFLDSRRSSELVCVDNLENSKNRIHRKQNSKNKSPKNAKKFDIIDSSRSLREAKSSQRERILLESPKMEKILESSRNSDVYRSESLISMNIYDQDLTETSQEITEISDSQDQLSVKFSEKENLEIEISESEKESDKKKDYGKKNSKKIGSGNNRQSNRTDFRKKSYLKYCLKKKSQKKCFQKSKMLFR